MFSPTVVDCARGIRNFFANLVKHLTISHGIVSRSHFSCPYFRNEIGGESERRIALTRQSSTEETAAQQQQTNGATSTVSSYHTPTLARGFSLLDSSDTYWRNGYCPYRKSSGPGGSSPGMGESPSGTGAGRTVSLGSRPGTKP